MANPRHNKFLKNLLEERMCATAAYMDAYKLSNRGTARRNASRLMRTNADIRQAIEEADSIQEEETRRFLIGQSVIAAEKVIGLMESDDETIILRAAKDILDRTGHKLGDNVKHSGEVTFNLAQAIIDGEV